MLYSRPSGSGLTRPLEDVSPLLLLSEGVDDCVELARSRVGRYVCQGNGTIIESPDPLSKKVCWGKEE